MLRRLVASTLRKPLLQTTFKFGGGGHHEIDYHAVVTKSTKSGIAWMR